MRLVMTSLLLLLLAATAMAETVQVQIICEVEYSQVQDGPLYGVQPGDLVVTTFDVDSENYIDSTSVGVRSYPIDMASFQLTAGTAGPIGLVLPQPGDATIYFCIRESDPVSDGFFLSAMPESPFIDAYIDVPGRLEVNFGFHYEVDYDGSTLATRDVVDAVGTYARDGIERYSISVKDGWADVLGLLYQSTVISGQVVPSAGMSWGDVKSLFR